MSYGLARDALNFRFHLPCVGAAEIVVADSLNGSPSVSMPITVMGTSTRRRVPRRFSTPSDERTGTSAGEELITQGS